MNAALMTALVGAGLAAGDGAILPEAMVTIRQESDLELVRQAGVSFAERRDGEELLVIGSPDEIERLRALGLRVEVTRADHRRPPGAYPEHLDPVEMAAAMEALAAAHPGRVELVDLGESREGRPLMGIRIGEGGWKVRILGAHHGDELVSAHVALALAGALLEEDLGPEVWVVPHVNPDGVQVGSRYNSAGVDLNRNYGHQWRATEPRSGSGPFSEPESRAIRTLSSYHPFASGLSLHGGALNWCYVLNWTTQETPDEERMVSWGQEYGSLCPLTGFYVINGADWYVTYGDTTDWSYGERGTMDVTLELSNRKSPTGAELQEVTAGHLGPMATFIGRPPSVLGVVLDDESGAPLEATVTPWGGQRSVAGPCGTFARSLDPGEVTIEVSHPGYWPETFELQVGQESRSLEVRLERDQLADLRPQPAILSWSEAPAHLHLDPSRVGENTVTLWRPGYPDVEALLQADGYEVVPAELAPGPWGIRTSQGQATPRAFFVGDMSEVVALEELRWDGEILALEGRGFGRGSRAWLVGGEERGMWPVDILEARGGYMELEAGLAWELEGPVDLVVVTSGAQLAAVDILGQVGLDTGYDTALSVLPGRGQCGCVQGSGFAFPLTPVILGWAITTRRRRRGSTVAAVPQRPAVGGGATWRTDER